MAKYKAYPEYKDSGIEWLGEIPAEWVISKVKYIAPFQVGWTPPTKTDANFVGDNLWVNISDLKGKFISYTAKCISDQAAKEASMNITPKGSLLYSFKLSVGSVAFTECDLYTNEAIASFLKNENISLSYLYYALPEFIIENASTNIYGAKILNQELIKSSLLLIPSRDEATKIAMFLDHETAKIDNLIEKQQQLIELLKEKRQAVISHAVTKGLNPDVPMKDSGVEWLGEVPEHWGVNRAKFISKIFVPQRNKPELNSDSGIFWVTMENMSQHYITSSHQRVSDLAASQSGSKILPKGAVIASCVGNFGVAAINKVDVIINQQLQAFQPVNVIADYLLAMVSISKNYFELIGTAATLIYVNKEGFENLPVLVPPESEQISICKFIDDNNEKFELLIDHSINQINLLQERRTALISAAVTGKIDVRDWVAPDTQEIEKTEETAA
ncbi:TPA: restriction endonuclease subunit S [Morganella morganii]